MSIDSDDGEIGHAGVIRFTAEALQFWRGWCADFDAKVFPVFRDHGFSKDAAAMIYIQKHIRNDLDDVTHAVESVREEMARWDVSTDEPREGWQGDGDNGA